MGPPLTPPQGGDDKALGLCKALGAALAKAGGDKKAEAALWDENFRTVYALAEACMDETMHLWAGVE